MNTFSGMEYAGVNVVFPTRVADRILAVAREDLAAAVRFVPDDAEPGTVIERWLDHRETVRPVARLRSAIPSAEPGDLLVKQREGAAWTFTVHGWQPLAPAGEPPASSMADPLHTERFIDEYLHREKAEERPREFVGPTIRQGDDRPREFTLRQGELRPPLFGDWSERAVEARAGRHAFAAIGELHGDADMLERLADHLAGGDVDSPFYEIVTVTRTFARALRYAATLVHKNTTTRQAP